MADFQEQSSIEHETTQKKVSSLDLELGSKCDLDHLSQITNQFKRFALYDDLKNLHTMVIPELTKFEHQMIQNHQKIDQFEQVIKNLDEVVLTK